ncbi:hypothetical protein ACSQ5K_15165 [Pseudomonas sp. PhalM4]
MMLDMACMQRFAVLWNGSVNSKIIHLIEQAIVSEQLSPVIMLHEFDGVLLVAYHHELQGERLEIFHEAWAELVTETMPTAAAIVFLEARWVALGLDGGKVFRKYALDVLTSYELGIVPVAPTQNPETAFYPI